MKNKLLLTLGALSFLSTFQLSAELIPITIGSNNTLRAYPKIKPSLKAL